MAEIRRDVKDAPIPNSVNHKAIMEGLQKDSNVHQLTILGKELLEQTNRPNIITFEQFQPFIVMFNMDVERYKRDKAYELEMNRLYNRWRKDLGINPYEVTIVIKSKEDPKELYHLDRQFTRIRSDAADPDARTMRDTVPAAVSKVATVSRDEQLLQASLADLMNANNTPEQRSYFTRVRMESALVKRKFVENNLSPEKRESLTGAAATVSEEPVAVTNNTTLVDDDD